RSCTDAAPSRLSTSSGHSFRPALYTIYVLFFFFMIRQPPRSTLFPYTRSSDLRCPPSVWPHTSILAARAVWRRLPASCSQGAGRDRKSTRLNSSHVAISYAVFCLKKKNIRRPYYCSQLTEWLRL